MNSSDRVAPGVGLAVGLGLRPHTCAERILSALDVALPGIRIACLATVDRRAEEPGVHRAAEILAVPLYGYPPGRLASVRVPNPSERVARALGTPGVAEAAALLAGTGPLIIARQVVSGVVLAAARAYPAST